MAKGGIISLAAAAAAAAAAAGSAAVWWWISRKRGPIRGSPAPELSNAPSPITEVNNVTMEDAPLEVPKPIVTTTNGHDLNFPINIQLLKEEKRCFNCFARGHPSALCAKKRTSRCMHCGQFGHKAYKCYSKA